MESDADAPSTTLVQCCDCGCNCSPILNRSLSGTLLRSVKRKFNEYEEGGSKFVIPGFNLPQNARVDVENECAVLREMVSSQQKTIQDLSMELEEERNAASSAANETMSMILRLQREKAEIQMEARQFKRFTEERIEHDRQELVDLEDLLYKREETIQSLTCEVQMYKHRMMSFGLSEAEIDAEMSRNGLMSRNQSISDNLDRQFESPTYGYPNLRCKTENQVLLEVDNELLDVEKYASGDTPHSLDQLKDLEDRINQLERSPRGIQPEVEQYGTKNMLEKVIVGRSPRWTRHHRKFSADSSSSREKGRERGDNMTTDSPRLGSSFKKTNYSYPDDYCDMGKGDNGSDVADKMSDRLYTIDSVYPDTTPKYGIAEPKASLGLCDDFGVTPRYSHTTPSAGDPDIQKLYARLQALEADRESMRQAIISMRTDKAQLVLLREIAQQFFKERAEPQRPPVRKPSFIGSFSFLSIFKWIFSFVFWGRKARQCKYMFGVSPNNAGLLVLLDKEHVGQVRCLSRTRV